MSDSNLKDAAAVPGNAVPATIPQQDDDKFIAEFANMNLDPLRDKVFMVSVNTGERNKGKFLTSRVHGPYEFLEMVEEVGFMWEQEQHHAKVIVLGKDRTKAVQFLDHKTTDYIEAHWTDIVAAGILKEAIMKRDEPFTHTATIIQEEADKPQEPPPQIAAPLVPDDEDEDL